MQSRGATNDCGEVWRKTSWKFSYPEQRVDPFWRSAFGIGRKIQGPLQTFALFGKPKDLASAP